MAKNKNIQKIEKVSVVIPHSAARAEFLKQLMDGLSKQTVVPNEIIVKSGFKNPYVNRNMGWRCAKYPLIWFLDDDMILQSDALERLLEVYHKERPDSVEGHIYGRITRIYDWGFMSGHILYTKAILEKVGGFDERFTGWRGDTDFGWSVLDAGGKIVYCLLSRAHHPSKSNTAPDIEAEKLLMEKHPELYHLAKKFGHLGTIL